MPDKPKKQDAQIAQEVQKKQTAQDTARAKRLAALRAALDPNSPEYRPELAKAINKAAELAADLPNMQEVAELLQEIDALEPFINAELAKNPGGETLNDYLDKYTAGQLLDMVQDPNSTFTKALETARVIAGQNIENQQSKRPQAQLLGLDKLGTTIFANWLDMEKELHGQIAMFPVKMEPDGYPKELTLYYDVRYPEELPEVEKKLTPFDRRIYTSIYNLQRTNGRDMTYTQIFKNALLGDKPTASQLERAIKSVDKMRRTTTKWDNREEAEEFNKEGTYMEYDGYLCPAVVITERKCFNGKPVEMYLRTLGALPIMEFARERKQIAQVPNYVLALPKGINATNLNIALIDYVAARIVRAKREGSTSLRILYNTLYKNIDATTRQKQRTALANLFVYLEELKTKEYIAAYQEETTKSTGKVGVTISLPNN